LTDDMDDDRCLLVVCVVAGAFDDFEARVRHQLRVRRWGERSAEQCRVTERRSFRWLQALLIA
jgi:hypothetical protein